MTALDEEEDLTVLEEDDTSAGSVTLVPLSLTFYQNEFDFSHILNDFSNLFYSV